MNHHTRGFSYMEMLIALGLFSILLMAALPLLNQASRNLAFAQDGYKNHLAAQNVMLSLRETLRESQETPHDSALLSTLTESYATQFGAESFSVFLWRNDESISTHSPHAPEINAALHGFTSLCPYTTVISVLVFNEFGAISGRAIGIF